MVLYFGKINIIFREFKTHPFLFPYIRRYNDFIGWAAISWHWPSWKKWLLAVLLSAVVAHWFVAPVLRAFFACLRFPAVRNRQWPFTLLNVAFVHRSEKVVCPLGPLFTWNPPQRVSVFLTSLCLHSFLVCFHLLSSESLHRHEEIVLAVTSPVAGLQSPWVSWPYSKTGGKWLCPDSQT